MLLVGFASGEAFEIRGEFPEEGSPPLRLPVKSTGIGAERACFQCSAEKSS